MNVLDNNARDFSPSRYAFTPALEQKLNTNGLPQIPVVQWGLSPEAREKAGDSSGLSSLLLGLSENYSEEGQVPVEEKAEKAQAAVKNVATPAGHASTLSKTLTQGKGAEKALATATKLGSTQEGAEAALKSADKLSDGLGQVGEAGGLAASPLSVATSSHALLNPESSTEDKVKAGSTLASDATSAAKLLGGASVDDGLSSLSKVASVQKGLAAKAPGAVSALGKVGKAAPVVGGIASGVSGALDIKDALQGKDVDKAKLVSGGLGVAAGVAMFVPGGQPVAAALGVTSLVIDNREAIGKGAKAVGRGIAKGAEVVGKGAAEGAKAVGKGAVEGAKAVGKGAEAVGKGAAKGAEAVGKGAAEGAKAVGKGATEVAGGAKKLVGKIF
ncbi:MAG: hypothetical protein WC314_05270 [Vulcanimicrobiota bacterium]